MIYETNLILVTMSTKNYTNSRLILFSPIYILYYKCIVRKLHEIMESTTFGNFKVKNFSVFENISLAIT